MIDLKNVKSENLSPELKILKMLDLFKEVENVIELPFSFIEIELKICHNSCKKYMRNLRDAGFLKFNLKGYFTLNPDVFDFTDVCSKAGLTMAKYAYEMFNSD